MTHPNDEQLPDGLREMADELRSHRAGATPLELDRIKLRAMAQASRAPASRQGKGLFMRSKTLTMALVLGLVATGGTAGVIAAGGHHGNGSAAKSQYCTPHHPNPPPGHHCVKPPPKHPKPHHHPKPPPPNHHHR